MNAVATQVDDTQSDGYHLYERTAKCATCQHEWTVALTGQAYRMDDDDDHVYWYAVDEQQCPICEQPAGAVTQPIAELIELGLSMWKVDEHGERISEDLEW